LQALSPCAQVSSTGWLFPAASYQPSLLSSLSLSGVTRCLSLKLETLICSDWELGSGFWGIARLLLYLVVPLTSCWRRSRV